MINIMKIAIIGGGWVGCHLANKLKNDHNVVIFEKNKNLFRETSYNNQNRLHLGFHYARNHKTRTLCFETFNQFMDDYGFLVNDIKDNLYCVPNKESLMDFETYLKIFNEFEYDLSNHNYSNIQGCIRIGEKHINFHKAFEYFNNELSDLTIHKEITTEDLNLIKNDFDIIVNSTNGHITINDNDNNYFESTISFLYEKEIDYDFGALTLVDGNLFSIYPYSGNTYTITDVINTPLKKFKSLEELNLFELGLDEEYINKVKLIIEHRILKYFPDFLNRFSYKSYFLSTKRKIIDSSDDRSPVITIEDNIINCFTGKIQGIYYIEKRIKDEIINRRQGISR